jgi:hypothetical protein
MQDDTRPSIQDAGGLATTATVRRKLLSIKLEVHNDGRVEVEDERRMTLMGWSVWSDGGNECEMIMVKTIILARLYCNSRFESDLNCLIFPPQTRRRY